MCAEPHFFTLDNCLIYMHAPGGGRFRRDFIVISRRCSEDCGFDSHCRLSSFHRDFIRGI